MDETAEETEVNPCAINYVIQATPSDYVKQVINLYLSDVFNCSEIKPGNIQLVVAVRNPRQMVAEAVEHEKY